MNSVVLKQCLSTLKYTRGCNIGLIRNLTTDKKPTVVPKGDTLELASSPVPQETRWLERHTKLITVEVNEDCSLVSGVPEEHIKTRTVRIYQPAKNAMQSGTDNIHRWQIDFDTRERWENPLMGWTSTGDPLSNMKVDFTTADEAIAHCEKMRWKWYIQKPNNRDPKSRSYGANFAWNKRTRVTTK